jgi:hypothetical protein
MNEKTLSERLRIKAGVMEMGEKIAWGSDTALMREAADVINKLEEDIAAQSRIIHIQEQKLSRIRAIELQIGEEF